MAHRVTPTSDPDREPRNEVTERYPEARGRAPAGSSRELVIFASVVMTFLCATLLVIVRLLLPGPPKPVTLPSSAQCRENDPATCPVGQACVGVECIPVRREVCVAGQTCAGNQCVCPEPTFCSDDKCSKPQNNLCGAPEVKDLLATIFSQCGKEDLGANCNIPELKRMMIEQPLVDQLFRRFPRALALHFLAGMPPVDGGGHFWKDQTSRAPYREFLGRYKAWLDEAKVIFIVGRASRTGGADHDILYGRERMDAARQWILDLYDDRPPAEAADAKRKIKHFTIGDHQEMDVTSFNQTFKDRFVAWDAEATRRLGENLRSPTLGLEEGRWTVQTLNQVAIVVPIPCDGAGGKQ